MSQSFIDRSQQQISENNQSETSQKKNDPVAQAKWMNSLDASSGWGIGSDQPTQMFASEEEEQVQKKSKDEEIQKKSSADVEPKKKGSSGTKTRMPNGVKSKMESSFGVDFSGVNIHQNSEQSSNIGALAHTQGNDVHFAPGQYNPGSQKGQELLGHELAHVVQQRQGRVKPTKQGKGMPINDNPALEKEADEMGIKAAQGKMVNIVGKGSGVQRKDEEGAGFNLNGEGLFSSVEVKEKYISNTKHRLTQSQGAYGDAILELKQEIKEAAKNVPSFASVLVDIAFGFLIPGVGKLASKMVYNISNNASDFLYAAALSVQNENITGPILSGLGGMTKKAFTDLMISKAVKTANGQADFADILYQENGIYIQSLRESIDVSTPDIQILNLFIVYDFNIVNKESYKTQIRKVLELFKNDVLSVDEMLPITYLGGNTAFKKLAYIDDGSRKLAIVQDHKDNSFLLNLWDSITGQNNTHYYLFDHWVSDEMREIAISKVGGEANVQVLKKDEVSGVK